MQLVLLHFKQMSEISFKGLTKIRRGNRGPGFDTWSGHILSFLFPLIQEGQLSVTGESMCTKYRLHA